jgi:exosome complex component RRP4
VDIRGRQDSVLHLSMVNMPGGAQRRRTFEDQLNMRAMFREEELISAEVHTVHADGSVLLHARSLKYGKLENGEFVVVAPGLVQRLKQHFVTLPCGVDAILGLNGYVWLTETLSLGGGNDALSRLPVGLDGAMLDDAEGTAAAAEEGLAEAIEKMKAIAASRLIDGEGRLRIARVRNALLALSEHAVAITPERIMAAYDLAVARGIAPKEMLHPDSSAALAQGAVAAVPMTTS